jgi:DNA-binding CsgD family transcriptional regulator
VLNKAGNNGSHHLHDLTDRELEVMILMAHGHSCHHSADKLHISPRTVQVHRNNIRLKIGLENALQLHAYAVRFYGDDSSGGEQRELTDDGNGSRNADANEAKAGDQAAQASVRSGTSKQKKSKG